MAMTQSQRVALMSSATPEWYTPMWLHARAVDFLGDGGAEVYDPCARPDHHGHAAPQGLAGRDNGLAARWSGTVFLNPPYGRGIGAWVRKALTEPIDEAILLVPARTDARWFQPLFDHTILFIRGRLHFSEGGRATFPSALVYVGPRAEAFAEAFADLGRVAVCRAMSARGLWKDYGR